MSKNKKILFVAVLLLLGLCVAHVVAVAVAYTSPPRIKVTCSTDAEGRLVINVRRGRRIRSLVIWVKAEGTEEQLWSVKLSKRKAWSITYGQEGPGVQQIRPSLGTPIDDIQLGSVFVVYAKFTASSLFMPAVGTRPFRFRMSEDGVPIRLPDE